MAESYGDRIISLVEQMKHNGEAMCIWMNIPLARQALDLIRTIPDEEGESPLSKAYACNAVMEHLSEYDTPRLGQEILRQELEFLLVSDEKSDWLTEESVLADIERLEAYIDPDHISNEEFSAKYGRTLKFDPIERTQIWEDNIYNAESAAFGLLADTPRGKGFYHAHWPVLQRVLALRGIPWKTPHQLNPKVMFD